LKSSTIAQKLAHRARDYHTIKVLQIAAFPSSLQSPGVPISAYTKKLVIIAKKKTTQEDRHKQERVS